VKPMRTLKRVEFLRVAHPAVDVERLADMLRYDVAFMCDAYPGVVAFPTFQTRGAGLHKAKATLGRWASFGARLVPLDGEAPTIDTSRAEWVTYRHPKDPATGATNFSKFERVTIQQFFAEVRE
jgi:hypothetical protein